MVGFRDLVGTGIAPVSKKTAVKIARGKKKPCHPRAYGPCEAGLSSRGLIFGGEEIFIPETWPIQKSYILEDE